jgi:hypothetical protein
MQIKNYRWVPPSFVLVFATITFLVGGCGGISSPQDIVWPDSGVSYTKQVAPFFQLACNNCHSLDNAQGGVMLDSYGSVRAINVVGGIPKDTNCILCRVMKVADPNHLNVPFIPTTAESKGVVEWVREGAQDN